MKSFNQFIVSIVLAGSFCTGCHLGPRYQPPEVATPENWKAQTLQPDVAANMNNWWEVFDDQLLNALEQQAFGNNPRLELALERVVEARATAGVTRADLYPQINLNPSYSNTGTLFKLYGVPTGLIPGLKPLLRVHELLFSLPAVLSYELDLWGKNRGLYESAVYNAEAQLEAYHASLLSLTADLASFYYNLRALDAQIDLYQDTVGLLKESLQLTKGRYISGLANAVDVSSAELELSNAEAQYFDEVRQRAHFENAIATLIGTPASAFCIEHLPIKGEPPSIPAGVPSTILLQRPDIAEAERSMASQHAQIGVAYAGFFPAITLTGTWGYLSPDLKDFLKWRSRYWQYGANAAQFAYDADKRGSELDVAWSRFRQAEASYQQIVLTAFEEVEDALSDLDLEAKQYETLDKSVRAADTTVKLSTRRYTNGIVDYFDVIQSQRSDVTAKSSLINLLGLRYQATIQLIKSLGGSWLEQAAAEEACGECQCKKCNQSHGPGQAEDDLCWHGFKEDSACDLQKVAGRVDVSKILQPLRHVLDRRGKS
jgi:multidrug efflux system outer membrane protein